MRLKAKEYIDGNVHQHNEMSLANRQAHFVFPIYCCPQKLFMIVRKPFVDKQFNEVLTYRGLLVACQGSKNIAQSNGLVDYV